MKNLLLVILFLALVPTAQTQDLFSIGPKIGYNSNTLTSNYDSITSGINNSLQIGAFFRLGKRVYLQPEANYQIVQGNLYKSTLLSIVSQDITVQSVKIPILVGVKLISSDKANFRILAGPAFTYMFNKELDPDKIDEFWPIQSVDDLKNSIWSLQVGAGLDVRFLTLDVRYEFGVENIYNGDSNFELKQNTFNVSLGIKLF